MAKGERRVTANWYGVSVYGNATKSQSSKTSQDQIREAQSSCP